jgi:hypothetical protein
MAGTHVDFLVRFFARFERFLDIHSSLPFGLSGPQTVEAANNGQGVVPFATSPREIAASMPARYQVKKPNYGSIGIPCSNRQLTTTARHIQDRQPTLDNFHDRRKTARLHTLLTAGDDGIFFRRARKSTDLRFLQTGANTITAL